MSTEINVLSRTQIIEVEPVSQAISIINAGPQGPGGPIGTSTGMVMLVGTTPPGPSDGAVGNWWLDSTADILYGPKAGSGTIWPIALYGAQPPPALLGENRVTTTLPYSATLLPVNVTLPANMRLRMELNLQVLVQAGATYAFDCRIDGGTVGRFEYPLSAGLHYINASVNVPNVALGAHTVSVLPNRSAGSGNCSFQVSPQTPGYLTVYKDRV